MKSYTIDFKELEAYLDLLAERIWILFLISYL